KSIREMRTGIGELRDDIARLARYIQVPEVQTRDGRTTACGGSGCGIYDQATVATRRSSAVWRLGS
ncbi:hypothetical protein HOY82DRAFT_452656, partial [Tuber indicum]